MNTIASEITGISSAAPRRSVDIRVSRTVPKAQKGEGKKIRVVLCLALFTVLLVQLFTRISYIETAYQIEELRRQSLRNDALLRQKRLEYAYHTRPNALMQLAEDSLGMIPLAPQRVRVIHN